MGTAENPHAGQGMVVLDIGGDIGALIVTAPASMEGVEIEIAPSGSHGQQPDEGEGWWQGDWHSDAHHAHSHSHSHAADGHHHEPPAPSWPHVAVVGRPSGDGTAYAAVYPGLRAGSYDLWVIGTDTPHLTAVVNGAAVTEIEWPGDSI